MEPIISPWIFYFMNMADKLAAAAPILTGASVIGAFAAIMIYSIENDEFIPWKYLKWFVIVGVAGLVMIVFIPNQETITKMLVASFITPDNIELGVEGVKAIFEYIMETAANLFGPVANGG